MTGFVRKKLVANMAGRLIEEGEKAAKICQVSLYPIRTSGKAPKTVRVESFFAFVDTLSESLRP